MLALHMAGSGGDQAQPHRCSAAQSIHQDSSGCRSQLGTTVAQPTPSSKPSIESETAPEEPLTDTGMLFYYISIFHLMEEQDRSDCCCQ